MTYELTILTYAALLQALQFCLYSYTATAQVGTKVSLGPRDIKPEITGNAARLQRALSNHFEGLILFTIAVTVVTLTDQSTWITKLAATNYLIARILYVPAYAFGLTPWRSVIWAWGWLSTIVMLVGVLL